MTPRELEILKIIHQSGGRCRLDSVSRKIGLSLEYSSLLSQALARESLIDYRARNNLTLTWKGKKAVENLELTRASEGASFSQDFRLAIEWNPKMVSTHTPKDQIIETMDARPLQRNIDRLTLRSFRRKRRKVEGRDPKPRRKPKVKSLVIPNGRKKRSPKRKSKPKKPRR